MVSLVEPCGRALCVPFDGAQGDILFFNRTFSTSTNIVFNVIIIVISYCINELAFNLAAISIMITPLNCVVRSILPDGCVAQLELISSDGRAMPL